MHGVSSGAFECTQPWEGAQPSIVQKLPSSQLRGGPPTHVPPEQASFVVQALPSLHRAVLFVMTHPMPTTHDSSVQEFPSLQLGGGPPTQTPPAQASLVVQPLPSLQGDELFAWSHPLAGMHESLVQGFASSQLSGGPPTQVPPAQASLVVQALPSLQAPVSVTVVVAFAELLPGVGSGVPLLAEAVFEMTVPLPAHCEIRTTIVNPARTGEDSEAMLHDMVPVPPTDGVEQLQPLGAAIERNVVPAGVTSLSCTLVAASGPLFVTVTV